MDVDKREVAEGEANAAAKFALNPLDRAESLARVRALVVTVLEDQRSLGRPAYVIDAVVDRLDPWRSAHVGVPSSPGTSSAARSASSSSISIAAMFSSRWVTELVPGISSIR